MIGNKLQNRYELRAELGRGGMGVVYRAWDPVLKRDVAIKMISSEELGSASEERFEREAQLVAAMDHPAIVTLHDVGRHAGALYFVMPFVEGILLQRLIEDQQLSLDDILIIGIQVAEALDHSHSRGVIHRDIKPGNVIVNRNAADLEPRARVLDFGLARDHATDRITRSGGLVGTLSNLSPELVSSGAADSRSDIYALGTVLYECLSGEPPFAGAVHSVLYRIVNEPVPSLSERGLELDPALERLVLRCLAKDPAARPQRGAEVAAELTNLRSQLDEEARRRSPGRGRRTTGAAGSPSPPSALAPMVGRQEEWSALQDRLERALVGECQFVLVEGDAGTGKSRLLLELENLARARRIRVLRGRFVDRESAIPYQGLCELILDHFRQHDPASSSSSAGPAREPTPSTDFTDLASDLVTVFPVLSEIRQLRESVSTEGSGPRSFDRDERDTADPTRLFELLARALARIGGGSPLVLVIENLHEGEVSLDALLYIVRRLGATPTLIVGSSRPSEVDSGHPLNKFLKSFTDDPRWARISLSMLAPADFRRLVEIQLGGAAVHQELLDRLYESTEGNPLFGQEMVRWLLETGSLGRDDQGRFALLGDGGLFAEALPSTIQQAIERRVERLDAPLRHVLSLASVLGKAFTSGDLESLVKIDGRVDDLDSALDELVERGVLLEDTKSRHDWLHFSSGVVRDVLYHELSRRKRRSLHRRYAKALEERSSHRLERVYPQLVHHFSEGDEAGKTIYYALLLAKKALAAYSPDDAVRACRTALEFVDEGVRNVAEGELLELLAKAHRAAGSSDKALREADAATFAHQRSGDRAAAARTALLAAETAWQARRVDEARSWVDRGLELAQRAGVSEVERRLLRLGATVSNLRGEQQQAKRYLDAAERLTAEGHKRGTEEELPRGGVLRSALPTPVKSIDPIAFETGEEAEVIANLFETLLTTDREGNPAPALACDWEMSADGRILDLELRSGVRFTDGKELEAEDVRTSFARLGRGVVRHPASQAVHSIEIFERSSSAGPKLRFHLAAPLPIFPALLSDLSTAVTRESSAGDAPDGQSAKILVGTGPFRLAEMNAERVVIERNPDYWRGTPPLLDRVEWRTDLDAAGIAERLRAGELDVGRDLLPDDLESLQRNPRFRRGLVETTRKNVYFLLFNTSGPAAHHPALRHALSGLVRPQDLVWRTLGRFAQPAVCFLPPGILGHDPGRRPVHLTREQAIRTLTEAEIETPLLIEAAIHPLFADRYKSLLDAIFSEWAELGVEVIQGGHGLDYFLACWSGQRQVDLLIGRWNADFDDPDTFTHTLFHSRGGRVKHFYCSPRTDRLLERARQERSVAHRARLYQSFERCLLEENVLLPLFNDIDYRIAAPRVKRMRLESRPPHLNYARIGKIECHEEAPLRERLAEGGELHVALSTRVGSLDPAATNVSEHFEIKCNIFEGLTRLVEGARVAPWLAAFFELPQHRGYHFRLRDEVRFHDGRRLTARDVRYSFERLLRWPDNELHYLLLPIRGAMALRDGEANDLEGFSILSAEQFVIELEENLSFFPALLTHPGLAIVPEGSDGCLGSWRSGCSGTGPFRVVRFDPEKGVDLEKNPHYWRPEHPKCRRLVFHYAFEPHRIASDFRAGRLSLANDLPPDEIAALGRDPAFAAGYSEAPRLSTAFLAFNSRSGFFTERPRRRALASLVDPVSLARDTLGRRAIPAAGLIPPGLLGFEAHPAQSSELEAERLSSSEAREILRGTALRIAIHPIFQGPWESTWRELHRRLASHGLDFEVSTLDYARWRTASPDIDLLLGRWIADYPDSDSFMMGLLASHAGFLTRLLDSPEIDSRITEGRRETDLALRHSIYRRIEEILAEERFLIPLFHEQTYRFFHPTVAGHQIGISLPEVRYDELEPAATHRSERPS